MCHLKRYSAHNNAAKKLRVPASTVMGARMAPPSRMPESSLQFIIIHSTRCCLHNWTRACQGAQSDQQCFHKADESAQRSGEVARAEKRRAKNQMTRGVWDCFLHSCCCVLCCCCHSDSFLDLRPFLASSCPSTLAPFLPLSFLAFYASPLPSLLCTFHSFLLRFFLS